jgi:hypothetical protein
MTTMVMPLVFPRTPRTNGGFSHIPNSSNVNPTPSPYNKAIHDLAPSPRNARARYPAITRMKMP